MYSHASDRRLALPVREERGASSRMNLKIFESDLWSFMYRSHSSGDERDCSRMVRWCRKQRAMVDTIDDVYPYLGCRWGIFRFFRVADRYRLGHLSVICASEKSCGFADYTFCANSRLCNLVPSDYHIGVQKAQCTVRPWLGQQLFWLTKLVSSRMLLIRAMLGRIFLDWKDREKNWSQVNEIELFQLFDCLIYGNIPSSLWQILDFNVQTKSNVKGPEKGIKWPEHEKYVENNALKVKQASSMQTCKWVQETTQQVTAQRTQITEEIKSDGYKWYMYKWGTILEKANSAM